MLDLPISQLPLVFLDTETTGLNPEFGDRVVEIALARFCGDVMENYFVTLVDPGRPSSPGAFRKHQIADAELRDAPRFRDVIPAVSAELAGAIIVGHNAPFDLGFLSNEFRLAGQPCPDNIVLDTLSLLRRHFDFPSNSLPRVALALGIAPERFHRALADVLTTREVFKFIVDRLASLGAQTGEDLLRLQGGSLPWPDEMSSSVPLPPEWEEALRLNRKVFLRYVNNWGDQSERWVSPIGVSAKRDYIYLRAFCHLRNEERSFRLDRVLEMRVDQD